MQDIKVTLSQLNFCRKEMLREDSMLQMEAMYT